MDRVMIRGITGKMGQETARTVINMPNFKLVAGLASEEREESLADILQEDKAPDIRVATDMTRVVEEKKPDIMIDFTGPEKLFSALKQALNLNLDLIVGSTGLSVQEKKALKTLTKEKGSALFIIPNFAIGAVLMMKFAKEASKYLSRAEIIEAHGEAKADAPSGTSLATAEGMKGSEGYSKEEDLTLTLPGVRGGRKEGVNIHSIRLPGVVARQEVIFGAEGQTLTITHNSLSRKSFMPGVELALEKITERRGFVTSLEELLGE